MTTSSSRNSLVYFTEMAPWVQPPDIRGCNVGKPVSIASGNTFFDQTDAKIPGVVGLEFTRSYNSVNRGPGQYGVFGPGWFHTYEQRLSFPSPGIIMLRRGDGVPNYFQDMDTNLTYEASLPFTTDSKIVEQPGQLERPDKYVRIFRRGGSETYDNQGRLTSIVDPSGNITLLSWDADQLQTITDPGSRTLTLSYTGGLFTGLYGPGGLIATYGYVGTRLDSVTYPDGQDEDTLPDGGYGFTYNATTGLLETVLDLTGRILEKHDYWGDGRAMTSELEDGREKYTLEYQPQRTLVTDARGKVTVYDYTSVWGQRLIKKITGPCSSCGSGGQVQEWTYDQKGKVETFKDAAGAITTYTYDKDTGDLLKEEKPLGHTTTYTYWPAGTPGEGRVHEVTAPNGKLTTYTHVAAGVDTIVERVQQDVTRLTDLDYTTLGQVEWITDPRGKRTQFGYDSLGDLRTATDPLGTSTSDPNDHVTLFEYDTLGRRTAAVDPIGNRTETQYDGRGRVLRLRQFDEGRPIDTRYTYDQGGRRKTATDGTGRTTDYDYDLYGRLWKVFQPDVNGIRPVTTYGYDVMSNLTSITDAEGRVTTFKIDDYNRVEEVRYPGDRLEGLKYDSTGQLESRTRGGVGATYVYDLLGRLKSKTFSDGTPAYSYTYDGNGDIGFLTLASQAGQTLTWDYDLAGQTQSEGAQPPSGPPSTVAYSYDSAGNREWVKLDGAIWLTYEHDDASRLDKIWRGASLFDFGYDDAHRRISLDHPNGAHTAYGHDDLSRLLSLTATRGSTTIASSAYTYDDMGNRLTKSHSDYAESYGYDSLHRLSSVFRAMGPGPIPETERYTYDRVGNRLSSLAAAPWAYNERNELLSYGPNTFGYNLRGNLTSKTDSNGEWTYEWNAENQLTRVLKNQSEVARYTYDPIGRRVERTAGGVTTTYTYDGEDILREVTSTGGLNKYIHGPGIDEPLAVEDGLGVLTYFHADGLGSVLKTTGSAGTVTESRQYDAFGNLEVGNKSGFAFTGREWDPETGLYYYRARYYDPTIGRFISEDPIGFHGGINFFAYVLNDPVNSTDPSGLDLNICHRQTHGVPNRVRTPHAVVFSTKTGKGHGFGPREGEKPLPGVPVPGQIYPEDPYDPNGKPKPGYQCSTRTTNSCIEDCYNEELPFQQAAPPNYMIAPRWMGGNVCTDWPQDMITRCTLKCAGKP